MTSYDVTSLFTNVPVKEAIQITADYLYEAANTTCPKMSKTAFIDLLELAAVDVCFAFGQHLYKQIDGVAMGSPLGPALANIFLGYYERELFLNLTKPPMYYRRYVDDTFVVFESQEEAVEFHLKLNDMHKSLAFTSEEESKNKLAFLDVLVERSENSFITTVYRKKTFTGQYMKWSSFAPRQRKINLIHTLVRRAVSICSQRRLQEELDKIKTILLDNGYPDDVVDLNIARRVELLKRGKLHGPRPCPLYMKLPWIGDKSVVFEKKLKNAVRFCFNAGSLRVIFSTTPLMKINIKDPLPTLARSNVVYNFECLCEKRYVGRTTQRLMDRITQHIPSVIRNHKKDGVIPDSKLQDSAIAQHLCENKDCADAYNHERFTILAQARSLFYFKTLKVICISSTKPILCRQKMFVYSLQVSSNF